MAFTTDEERGVTFRYEQLDPQAQYRVRLSLVRPRYARRYAGRQHQTGESIFADNFPLAENLELPEYRADFFEFDIPKAATSDGKLTLWLKKQPGIGEGLKSDVTVWRNTGGWGTLVSEVWLMKKGMPPRHRPNPVQRRARPTDATQLCRGKLAAVYCNRVGSLDSTWQSRPSEMEQAVALPHFSRRHFLNTVGGAIGAGSLRSGRLLAELRSAGPHSASDVGRPAGGAEMERAAHADGRPATGRPRRQDR